MRDHDSPLNSFLLQGNFHRRMNEEEEKESDTGICSLLLKFLLIGKEECNLERLLSSLLPEFFGKPHANSGLESFNLDGYSWGLYFFHSR